MARMKFDESWCIHPEAKFSSSRPTTAIDWIRHWFGMAELIYTSSFLMPLITRLLECDMAGGSWHDQIRLEQISLHIVTLCDIALFVGEQLWGLVVSFQAPNRHAGDLCIVYENFLEVVPWWKKNHSPVVPWFDLSIPWIPSKDLLRQLLCSISLFCIGGVGGSLPSKDASYVFNWFHMYISFFGIL